MKGVFRRIGMTLVPAGDTGREALLAVKEGQKCAANVRTARNPEQHNLWFALCQLCADATDDTKDNIRKWLLHKLNYVDVWFDPQGNMHVETQSVAFESMEQAVFNRVFQESINLIADRLQTTPEAVRQRFDELVRGRAA